MQSAHLPDPQKVRTMFGHISQNYDRANGVISMGLHKKWRRQLVAWSGAQPGDVVLDCATGTGDLALDFKRVVGVDGRVIGTDFCAEMLELAPGKAKRAELEIEFALADTQQLPYPDNTFDIVSIAYGIRNVADPVKGLSEMARVCKPGGVVMVLETGQTEIPLYRELYRLYFHHLIPRLGQVLTGNRGAYKYLQESAFKFPYRENFLALMTATKMFQTTEYRSLLGGVSYIYKGRKLPAI